MKNRGRGNILDQVFDKMIDANRSTENIARRRSCYRLAGLFLAAFLARTGGLELAALAQDETAPLVQQAKDAIDKKDFVSAIEPLQKLLARHPDDPFTHFQLGYAFAGLKRWDDAKTEFVRATTLDPTMAPAYLNLGLVLLDRDPAGAAAAFRQAATLLPAESHPRYLAGSALERAGKFAEAADEYRRALAVSPKDYESHAALGNLLLRDGKTAEADAQFREALAQRADYPPAQLGLANVLLAKHQAEAGSAALAEYLKLVPGDREARTRRVSALVELSRWDEALAELDRAEAGAAPALENNPENVRLRASIFIQQKNWQSAYETLTRGIQLSPRDPQLVAWMGHVQIEMRHYPEAVSVLNQAIAMDPKSPEPLRDMVNALFLAEDYGSTLSAMDRLAKMESPKPGSWFVRAICYDKLSRKAEAIDAYQKFLDLDHGQNETQNLQARHRMLALQNELGRAPNKKKK